MRTLVLIATLLVALPKSHGIDTLQCPDGWESYAFAGTRFYKQSSKKVAFSDAAAACEEMGLKLAKVDSLGQDALEELLAKQLVKKGNYWLDLHNPDKKLCKKLSACQNGDLKSFTSGESVVFNDDITLGMKIKSNECVRLNTKSGKLQGMPCNKKRLALCQAKSDSCSFDDVQSTGTFHSLFDDVNTEFNINLKKATFDYAPSRCTNWAEVAPEVSTVEERNLVELMIKKLYLQNKLTLTQDGFDTPYVFLGEVYGDIANNPAAKWCPGEPKPDARFVYAKIEDDHCWGTSPVNRPDDKRSYPLCRVPNGVPEPPCKDADKTINGGNIKRTDIGWSRKQCHNYCINRRTSEQFFCDYWTYTDANADGESECSFWISKGGAPIVDRPGTDLYPGSCAK